MRPQKCYTICMENGIKGTHLATGQPVEIELNDMEMNQATDKSEFLNILWSEMCKSVMRRTGIVIEGQISIDWIVIKGVAKEFH